MKPLHWRDNNDNNNIEEFSTVKERKYQQEIKIKSKKTFLQNLKFMFTQSSTVIILWELIIKLVWQSRGNILV